METDSVSITDSVVYFVVMTKHDDVTEMTG